MFQVNDTKGVVDVWNNCVVHVVHAIVSILDSYHFYYNDY